MHLLRSGGVRETAGDVGTTWSVPTTPQSALAGGGPSEFMRDDA
jgi:hypothetical protein